MAFYNRQSRDPSAVDTRRSSSDDVVVPLLVTIAITALVVAGIYFFPRNPTRVADTSVGPAVTQLTEPSLHRRHRRNASRVRRKRRFLVSDEVGDAGQTPVLSRVLAQRPAWSDSKRAVHLSARSRA